LLSFPSPDLCIGEIVQGFEPLQLAPSNGGKKMNRLTPRRALTAAAIAWASDELEGYAR